jgi:N-acetylmuramoyl-L-alanine amidase
MVPEALRAWHAGVGRWGVDRDINSCSIGIEIHNPGHELGYTDFPAPQMAAVVRLALDITRRNAIPPERVLAHSDIAPLRKMDPGEKFPWQKLSAAGVGVWAEPVAVEPDDPGYGPGAGGPVVTAAQRRLIAYGYGLEPTGEMDGLTTAVVAAFQRHFRPARVDGRLDGSTVATLERLLAITTSG